MFTHEDAMKPILTFLRDGKDRTRLEIAESLAHRFDLSDIDRAQMLPSGATPTYRSRTGWGLSYLRQAGLIERPRRGIYHITASGLEHLAANPDCIDTDYLKKTCPEFAAWREECAKRPRSRTKPESNSTTVDTGNPEEVLGQAIESLRQDLVSELLDAIKSAPPDFFERLVVQLLVKMGYGGSFEDAAQSVGQAGDGGIDGIIKEDRLGLDTIYLQAKRWEGTVGRPEIQKFVGAITGFRSRKGVFVTTSRFSSDAHEYVQNIDASVVLIDGSTLAEYMIETNLGVTPEAIYEVKRMDSDFFEA